VGAIATGLLVASFGVAQGEDDPPFRNGTAKATAVSLRVAPGVGSLQLALGAGISVAEYRNGLAQSQSEALDLGLIGSVLSAPSSCTGNSIVDAESLPKPTRVDNRAGDAELVEDEYPLAGAALCGVHKVARATTLPSSNAVSQPALLDLPGLLKVDTIVADASTRVIDGNTREAHATVEASITIAGAIKLSGLRWDALHRTGAQTVAEATFDPGTGSLLGIPVPLESLGSTETVVNNLLGAANTGITVTFPKVERFTEPADVVRMTPLRIVLKDSGLGAATLGPIMNLTRVQREQLFNQIASSVCELAGVPLIADIGLAILGGTGFIIIDIGGAEATTSDLEIGDPFGDATAPPAVSSPGPLPTLPTIPGNPVLAGGPTQQPVAEVGPLRDRCESVNTLRHTACSEGTLLAAGILGLVATAGVGVLDWRHQRRRRAAAAAVAGGPA
jgi:hypothetical protein